MYHCRTSALPVPSKQMSTVIAVSLVFLRWVVCRTVGRPRDVHQNIKEQPTHAQAAHGRGGRRNTLRANFVS